MNTPPNTVTIRFRAKLDEFAGGKGYKVPKLTSAHVDASGGMLAHELLRTLNDPCMTTVRLEQWAFNGESMPGVIWAPNDDTNEEPSAFRRDTSAWKIVPRGNGFMADISITLPLERKSNR